MGEAPDDAVEKFGERVECGHTIIVRCAADDAVRAAALFDGNGLAHLAVEPGPFGAEALEVLKLCIAER